MRDVFISYHTSSASDIVHAVCTALKNAGISFWYAPRDVEGEFADSIIKAIRACKIFLLILNEQANHSGHVLNEVSYAFERFQKQEEIILLPFRVDHSTFSDNMRYYLGRIHVMNGVDSSGILHIQELVNRIKKLLGKEASRTAKIEPYSNLHAQKTYRLITSLVYPDTHFVGRETELAEIENQLQRTDNKVFLVGMGGIGKSEIARMYMARHAQEYDVALWIPFQESLQQTIANDSSFLIEGMSQLDYPFENQRKYAERKLDLLKRIADRRILIVVDNFDVQTDPDLESFCSGQYAVIFTTRYHQNDSRIREIDILPMSEETDLMKIFRLKYPRAMGDEDFENVKRIIQLIEGHTLSIRLIASAMRSGRIRPDRMLSMLKEGSGEAIRTNEKLSDQIFGQLKKVFRFSMLNKKELYILKNLSLISNKGLDVETFYEWCEIGDFDIIDGLIQRNWVIHDPVQDVVHLHPLIVDLMLEKIRGDSVCCSTMLRNFYKYAMSASEASYHVKLCSYDISHTIWERLPNHHCFRNQLLEAKIAAIFDMGMWWKAFSDCQLLIKISDSREQKLYAYSRLALGYMLLRKAEEGLKMAKEGYSLVSDVPDSELSQREGYLRSWIMLRIAETSNMLGDYQTALTIAEKCYQYCDRFYEPTPENSKCRVKRHIAAALYNLGRLQEGMEVLSSAIHFFEQTNDMRSAAYSYEKMGLFLAKVGNYSEALSLNQKAKDALIPLYGSESVSIADTWEYRAQIYAIANDKDNAISCWKEAIALYQKIGADKREIVARRDMNKVLNGEELLFIQI